MKICVIPARGGSKRIPRKNLKLFYGKPMIAWSIEAAKAAGCFDRIVVSTDDYGIAEVAKDCGAEIPFLRPSELADDFATTGAVMAHAVRSLDTAAEYCCLYATAPFVQSKDLSEALALLTDSCADFVFSATSFPFPIQRAIRVADDKSVRMVQPEHLLTRSQDLDEMFHDAGQFYWGSAIAFVEQRPFFSPRSRAFLIPRYRVQDVDTPEDWERAELMMGALQP